MFISICILLLCLCNLVNAGTEIGGYIGGSIGGLVSIEIFGKSLMNLFLIDYINS